MGRSRPLEDRLYDEKVTEPGVEWAARMKYIVKEYAAKVEERQLIFRKHVAEVLTRYSPGLQPKKGETSRREGGVPLAIDELLAAFHLSQNASRVGDMDRMMGAGNSTPEQTSRSAASPVRSPPQRNLDPVLIGEQLEASVANLADQAEEMVETGTQPDEGTRPEGDRESEPEGQLDGEPEDEPEWEEQEQEQEQVEEEEDEEEKDRARVNRNKRSEEDSGGSCSAYEASSAEDSGLEGSRK